MISKQLVNWLMSPSVTVIAGERFFRTIRSSRAGQWSSSWNASKLARHPNLTVLSVGGRVRPRSLACVNDWALDTLSRLRVTVAFLGTNGLSAENGLTTPDPAEAAVKRATLSIAQHTVLLADHSKIGVASLLRYGDLDQIQTLITDTTLPQSQMRELQDAGLRVIRA